MQSCHGVLQVRRARRKEAPNPCFAPLHAFLLSFAAVVTVFAALLSFTLLFKLPTACKCQLHLKEHLQYSQCRCWAVSQQCSIHGHIWCFVFSVALSSLSLFLYLKVFPVSFSFPFLTNVLLLYPLYLCLCERGQLNERTFLRCSLLSISLSSISETFLFLFIIHPTTVFPYESKKPRCSEHGRSGAKALPLGQNLAQGGAVILGRWNSPW